jgi:hypothetical protein
MIKPEQIPQAVKMAWHKAYWEDDMSDMEAFVAALNAWPGAELDTGDLRGRVLILPLPKEGE